MSVSVSIRAPRLFVLRLSVTNTAGTRTRRQAWCMPSAPFGSPAWQLPTVAAHLVRLHRHQTVPTLEAFAAQLAERAASPIPAPRSTYRYDPLHDPRVSCWLDLHIEPAQGAERWPRCSLATLEQETGRCTWSRITRDRGAHAVITHTHAAVTAEEKRLAEELRTRPDPGTAAVHDMTVRMNSWTQQANQQVQAEQTLIRAGQRPAPKPQTRRSVRVSHPQ